MDKTSVPSKSMLTIFFIVTPFSLPRLQLMRSNSIYRYSDIIKHPHFVKERCV